MCWLHTITWSMEKGALAHDREKQFEVTKPPLRDNCLNRSREKKFLIEKQQAKKSVEK